ncbi:MAG TPA: homoserine O-acetyltransferase [Vicinamibacteria bacterium]|nr:homoserine O-acetyltransferase [Vicinamibacteria bacterium]
MSSSDSGPTSSLQLHGPFELESGERLPSVTVAYRTWGRLDARGDNAVLVCHALTGSADVDRWWGPLLGAGRALDPERDFVVCSNVLGGCYGTTGPTSPRPGGSGRWGGDFPAVTVRDMVRVEAALLDALGVRRLRLVIGGSLGGMQVLEWALLFPDRVDALAPIAVSARHSAWCIALSAAQREAIYADPRWRGGHYPIGNGPEAGLAVARQIAMCTYRSRASLEARFSRAGEEPGGFAVEGWLQHHGRALVDRFDASTYVTLTKAMDTHDVGRGRGGWREVLATVRAPALVLSIDTDVLYPPVEQEELAAALPAGRLLRLGSPHGHDAFLIEGEVVNALVSGFRRQVERGAAREEGAWVA